VIGIYGCKHQNKGSLEIASYVASLVEATRKLPTALVAESKDVKILLTVNILQNEIDEHHAIRWATPV
jgi:hypothetical protein